MSKKMLFNQINLIVIALILFACGTPGTEISSPIELDSASSSPDTSSESDSEEPTEPSTTAVPVATNTPEPSLTPSIPQDELIEKWRPSIGAYFLGYAGCQIAGETLLEFVDSADSSGGKFGSSLVVGLFLNAIREAVIEWEPHYEKQTYKDNVLNYLDSILETVGSWFNDELSVDDAISDINATCVLMEGELEDIGNAARENGLSEESMEAIGQAIESSFTELQEDIDIEEGEEEIPINTEVGMSRGNPFPLGEMHTAPNWDIQVIESIRGDDAWQMIQAANSFNEPPVDGMEYILVKLKAISKYEDSDEHDISSWDFNLTGSHLIKYGIAEVVEPDPGLDATLYTGGETEGWVAFSVGTDEDNFILIFDESANWDEDRLRFFAVDDGASITVDMNLSMIQPTDLGIDRSDPAPFGETVFTEDWEIAVNEVIRGDEAWQMVQSANQFNDPPEEGMEYILVKVWVRNIGSSDTAIDMDGSSFKSTGSNNTLYDMPYLVDPEPALDVSLFSGGVYEGWLTLLAAEGESSMMAVFTPWTDWDDTNRRFLVLEP